MRALVCLALTQARIVAMCSFIPPFGRNALPGRLRVTLTGVLGAFVLPLMLAQAPEKFNMALLAVLLLKEVFVGICIGYVLAIPFWIFESIGTFIDNQRGAGIASIFNPELGSETTPLGTLLGRAYAVLFFTAGGFTMFLTVLYDSYLLWDPWRWSPELRLDALPLWLGQVDTLLRLTVLYSGPAIIVMLLAEMGLGLASRFTPQLQVFFLAMPIKSALGILMLALYLHVLAEYANGLAGGMGDVLSILRPYWEVL
ncbi:type III secretion system export apparatus subunit SctT [Bordetella sp. N]|uniref:type III secretion system export apparatus subunit SctT n=1 Tax=Bordetella sp. N TaxID=1746199 RepID=UPI0018D20F63|nr:type III secretion system export apparatus subunit SctT [Bordetella sp. N]